MMGWKRVFPSDWPFLGKANSLRQKLFWPQYILIQWNIGTSTHRNGDFHPKPVCWYPFSDSSQNLVPRRKAINCHNAPGQFRMAERSGEGANSFLALRMIPLLMPEISLLSSSLVWLQMFLTPCFSCHTAELAAGVLGWKKWMISCSPLFQAWEPLRGDRFWPSCAFLHLET